ncbi:MAG: NrfD/PsrC family molybdoenzyme membrane anchor subunit [Gemmatimonadaceae bacterium]
MPDTFFTIPPDWTWWIIFYFFIGGIAGGSFFLASMLYLLGRPADRPVVRIGYYVAFIGAVISGLLLVLDLHRPLRFWHMLIESNTGQPMFKAWTPMSIGSWALLLFGLFATLAALSAVRGEGRARWAPEAVVGRGFRTVVAIIGGLLGFFLAGYTGVLLSVSNRPVWADSPLLGMLFLFSAGSTAAATLILVARRRDTLVDSVSLGKLADFDKWALVLELITLVAFLITLGAAARVFLSVWGVVLLLGVIGLGIVLPLVMALGWVRRWSGRPVMAAGLVLAGGFLLRVVTLMSSESVSVAGSRIVMP